jgi:KipI family sensor histidine kinase inhibitor
VSTPRLRHAGDAAIVVELGSAIDPATNARAVALAERLRRAHVHGVHDVLATFRSVAVFFDPLHTDVEALRARLFTLPSDQEPLPPRALVEIPVEYGGDAGPDLEAVATGAGLTAAEVIARHAAPEYRVFMIGFLPGFAYLGTVDAAIAAPRLATPRLRVAPGSVGIAGPQTGIYPQASPGGWQIVGRTTTRPFDPQRSPPSMFAPGDRLRFVPVPPSSLGSFEAAWTSRSGTFFLLPHTRGMTVVRPGLMTTVQDGGRQGHQHEGVPVSGAMDAVSMRDANRAVGNPPAAGALEIMLGGVELRLEHAGMLAIAGADLSATLDGRAVAHGTAVEHAAGSVVRFETRRRGARAYLALDGGIALPPCLGSVSTDLTSAIGGVGGRRLQAGDRLPVGEARPSSMPVAVRPPRPLPEGGARVRVLPGPHGEWFPAAALDLLCRTRYEITPESNRMGYRLRGAQPLPRDGREMVSDATCPGSLQVPPSGQPILLTADRQVTGGYPIVATVITADLPVVGQLAPGDWIEFDPCSRAEALAALAHLDVLDGRA